MKQITIAGNITKDAELRTTQGGDKVAGFNVAVNDREKNAWFFTCSLWGKRAEALTQYLTKGSAVTVTGDFSTQEYKGTTYLQVRASEVALQGGRKDRQDQGGSSSSGQGGGPDLGDYIPFSMEWRL